MTKGIFITGTDTGVGKTVVAAGLACLLSRQEKKTAVMKPVQTGGVWQNGRLISEDLELLKSGISLNEPQELLNPYCFPEPCSPHLAARLAGTKIEPGKIIGAYGQLALKYERVIVEGAGGLLVPLTEKYLLADLVRDLNLPLVIVVSNRLGVINHAVLTVECARQRGLEILGIVINHT
ncbi:MAG: dethiobiotin synthase, partial [Candidatus Schekmanbacteria bacterium]|nr:dethiobiotin synthase [Candidatus Schekmanbacteria bacterium]